MTVLGFTPQLIHSITYCLEYSHYELFGFGYIYKVKTTQYIQMSGFTLIGPLFTFRSIAGAHCWGGYSGTVSSYIESILVNQQNKTLDISVLPTDIRTKILEAHLGDNFAYTVMVDDMQWHSEMSQRIQKLGNNINEMLKDIITEEENMLR